MWSKAGNFLLVPLEKVLNDVSPSLCSRKVVSCSQTLSGINSKCEISTDYLLECLVSQQKNDFLWIVFDKSICNWFIQQKLLYYLYSYLLIYIPIISYFCRVCLCTNQCVWKKIWLYLFVICIYEFYVVLNIKSGDIKLISISFFRQSKLSNVYHLIT